uniref:C-type lectin n=1 Tax=Sebastes schlegelii TaxID=214486 RepID=A0A1C8Y947_SEBSC|nr:C-type lectin [Sebastes schlegelii]
MSLIKTEGSLRGLTILCVLIGLLASSQAADCPEGEASSLKLQLNLLRNRFRHLCDQYSNLATNCSAPVIPCAQCPEGWLVVGDQCFLLTTDRDDYSNSTNKCAEIGAHLAILTTKEQHDAVEKEGKNIGGIYTYYWIGLTDIETEGDWRWVDNSKLRTPFWEAPEPNNHLSGGPEGEDCAVVQSYTQLWHDVPCSFTYPRICQMDAILPQ